MNHNTTSKAELYVPLSVKLSGAVSNQVNYKVRYHFSNVTNCIYIEDSSAMQVTLAYPLTKEESEEVTNFIHYTVNSLVKVNRKFSSENCLFSRDRTQRDSKGAQLFAKGVIGHGTGHVIYTGFALALVREVRHLVQRMFTSVTSESRGVDLEVPSSIDIGVLNTLNYVPSFHHHLCFVSHLNPREDNIKTFPKVWQNLGGKKVPPTLFDHCSLPERALNPAICLHAYEHLKNRNFPAHHDGEFIYASGKAFRFESGNHSDYERLFEFSMHELIYIGPDLKTNQVATAIRMVMSSILEQLDLAGDLVIANDMFISDNAAIDQSRIFSQLSTQSKIELRASYGTDFLKKMAIASLNVHANHFTKALDITEGDERDKPASSLCFGIGIERLAYAMASQHGTDAITFIKQVNVYELLKGLGIPPKTNDEG